MYMVFNIFVLALATYGSDTGTCFAGVFGKHKLILKLSPKKTIEGSISAGVLSWDFYYQLDMLVI